MIKKTQNSPHKEKKELKKEPECVIHRVEEVFEIRKGNYSIMVRVNRDKSLTIGRKFEYSTGNEFVFKESKSEVVRAIGELLIKAANLAEK